MSNFYRSFEQNSEALERRYNNAKRDGDTAGMYAACQDYEKYINSKKNELNKMDPNSKEYEKASRAIDTRKSHLYEMEHEQRFQTPDQDKVRAYQQLENKNTELASRMSNAAEKGNVDQYQTYREQYEKNLNVQDKLGKEMRSHNVEYRDTSGQSRQFMYGTDCTMRDKLGEKISQSEAKGKTVKPEDRDLANKYRDQVKKDEEEMIKHNGERILESKQARGASQQELDYQRKENQENLENYRRRGY